MSDNITTDQSKALANVNQAFGGVVSTGNPIQDALEKKVLGNSGIVSSAKTGVDKVVEGIQAGKQVGENRILSDFKASKDVLQSRSAEAEKIQRRRQNGIGINTQFTALAKLRETTDKNLKDLVQRKEDALLANDTNAAQQIGQLELQAIQFQQQAEQQAFSNMFNIAQLQLEDRRDERIGKQFNQTFSLQKQQFNFNQQGKIADIATQFGLTVDPGETLDSITNKAKPLASAEQRARLDKLQQNDRKEGSDIQSEGLLRDAMLGQGIFKDIGELTPESAAFQVATILRSQGFEINSKKLNDLTALAIKLSQDKNDIQTRVQAEEEGKMNFKLLAGTGFQPFKPKEPDPLKGLSFKGLDFSKFNAQSEDTAKLNLSEDPLDSFLGNLFGPSL